MMSVAAVALVFSQFDLILVRALIDLLVNYFTLTRFMKNKSYDPHKFNRFFEQENEELSTVDEREKDEEEKWEKKYD